MLLERRAFDSLIAPSVSGSGVGPISLTDPTTLSEPSRLGGTRQELWPQTLEQQVSITY